MAELSRRRIGELQRGIFGILDPYADGLPAKEVIAKLNDVVPPTPFESSMYPNRPDVRRFDKIARFVTISLVKAGWLTKDRGHWSLTDEGRAAYRTHTDPEAFAREAVRLYRFWKKDQPDLDDEQSEEAAAAGDTLEEAEAAAATLEEAEEAAWGEIESYLSQLHPYDFQDLVAAPRNGLSRLLRLAARGRQGDRHCGAYGSARDQWSDDQGAGEAAPGSLKCRQHSRLLGGSKRQRCRTLRLHRGVHKGR